MEEVIIVDENDRETGAREKLKAHREGMMHRAFSVFVFNSEGKLLLQRRAETKYHSPGLWSNTCCGHPRPGESTESAAHRRLREEMGFDCELKEIFGFTYRVEFENGLIENEYDHVFTGNSDSLPECDPEEVDEWKYMDLVALKEAMQKTPEKYTYWLRFSFVQLLEHLTDNKGVCKTPDAS
jgi:isopentenyl-diphosphate delta-isomerase